MRLGINIVSLYPGKIGGAEQYVRNLLKQLMKIDNLEIWLMINPEAFSTFLEEHNLHLCEIKWEEDRDAQMNFLIDYNRIEIMFSPLFFIAPEKCSVPTVASILDVQHEFFPEYFERKVLESIRSSTHTTLEQVDGIITISNFSKETISEKYNVNPKKIQVTYLNSDECFETDLNEEKLLKIKKKIGYKYLFYPANTWPHKNHMNLLKAYVILKNKYNMDMKLVFTGDGKQEQDEIKQFIRMNSLEDNISYLGYLPQGDMPYVFANAEILVFPSVFEGFGIPLVEAMRAGTPIVCSQCGSIPEVAGEAALYFDAYNPEDIAEKIYLLQSDETLKKNLINKGKRQAQRYSWKRCAEDTFEYLNKIYSQQKPIEKANRFSRRPLVSIVTPSYNQGEFIKETIESVLGQSYSNIEYIVLDGASTDNTVDILKTFDDKLTWVSEKDEGQADAVNKGIRRARGEIIGWLNSDDTYFPETIEKIVEYFYDHPCTDMVYGEAYYIDKDGNITERYHTEKFNRKRLAEQCIICQPTAFFTREIVEKVGLLEKEYQLSMDYELWMRISGQGKIAYIPEYLATSRMYEENKTLSRRDEVYKETCAAVKKHFGYVPVTWIDGYADYLCKGKRGLRFHIRDFWLFIKYNKDNKVYLAEGLHEMLAYRKYLMKSKIFKKKDMDYTEIFPDKWIAKKYIQELKKTETIDRVVIKGNHLWPMKEALVLKIYIGGKLLRKEKIREKGSFCSIVCVAKEKFSGDQDMVIKINKCFCPVDYGLSQDQRYISCQIESIDICLKEEK